MWLKYANNRYNLDQYDSVTTASNGAGQYYLELGSSTTGKNRSLAAVLFNTPEEAIRAFDLATSESRGL